MNTEKLLRLADLVETIAPEKFDLDSYGEKKKCGTVCCALGWAAQNSWFVKRGFAGEWNKSSLVVDEINDFFDITGGEEFFLFYENSYVTHPAHPSEVAIRIRLFVEHHDEKVVRELELA